MNENKPETATTLRQFLIAAQERGLDVSSNAGWCFVDNLLADHNEAAELDMPGLWTHFENGEETFSTFGADGLAKAGDPLYRLRLVGWKPTHQISVGISGEQVMLVPDSKMDAIDASSLYPTPEYDLTGSVSAFTAHDWQHEDATGSYRRLPNATWLYWADNDNKWETVNDQVTVLPTAGSC